MKKSLVLSALLFVGAQMAAAQEKESVSIEQLPKEISSYVENHFSGISIRKAHLDKENPASVNYGVKLDDGTKLGFNSQFEIIEIDGKKELPESVIPSKIKEYVAENHPEAVVTEWSLKNFGKQEVGLNNDVDLVFDKNGKFISVNE